MKHVLYILFLLSGIFPAAILFFLTVRILISVFAEFNLSLKGTLLIINCLLGSCGFAGLILLLAGLRPKLYRINLLLLVAGISGFIMFNSLFGGKRAWQWILKVEEPGEWFVVVWPNIVTLIFSILILKKVKVIFR